MHWHPAGKMHSSSHIGHLWLYLGGEHTYIIVCVCVNEFIILQWCIWNANANMNKTKYVYLSISFSRDKFSAKLHTQITPIHTDIANKCVLMIFSKIRSIAKNLISILLFIIAMNRSLNTQSNGNVLFKSRSWLISLNLQL